MLRLELSGTARVDIYRSKIDGARIAVTGKVVGEGATGTHVSEFEVPLSHVEDGGWTWFDLTL